MGATLEHKKKTLPRPVHAGDLMFNLWHVLETCREGLQSGKILNKEEPISKDLL